MTSLVSEVVLTGRPRNAPPAVPASYVVVPADARTGAAYRRLRHDVFVREQSMFAGSDADDVDDDPRTRVLVALSPDGALLGGVRVHPARQAGETGAAPGWWRGSRLVVSAGARAGSGVGPGLVRAACALAEQSGALRFDAVVQARHTSLFTALGWQVRGEVVLHDRPHVQVDWPVARVQRLVDSTKAALGGLLDGLADPPAGYLGDDAAPVPGSDLVAACDAVLPAMVERDPEWAGWCAVLVNVNDLCAMGATPVGLLDAVAGRDASFVRRILRGLGEASRAWGVPVLGGHTQTGVPAALSVTALGRTSRPVPAGGGRPGHRLRVSADLGGGWRAGYSGSQWDSSSHRSSAELRALTRVVPGLAPAAAKDVSMAGLVGTAGMLAESSGCRAVLDVEDVPAPAGAGVADWLTCFPGFAVITADDGPDDGPDDVRSGGDPAGLPGFVTSAVCGDLVPGSGVGLRWSDGVVTEAVTTVTGLGAAGVAG